jgi:hypothetical protein
MLMGRIFFPVKNLIMARLNRMFLTGTEQELWLAVGSRLCVLEGRYHMTVWNQFYCFHYSNKKYDRRQTLSAHTCMILTVFFLSSKTPESMKYAVVVVVES